MEEYITLSETRPVFGERTVYRFPNGLGASVIRGEYSYGGKQGLFELAVLDTAGEIDYDTEIASDVIGHLTEGDVLALLERIKAL